MAGKGNRACGSQPSMKIRHWPIPAGVRGKRAAFLDPFETLDKVLLSWREGSCLQNPDSILGSCLGYGLIQLRPVIGSERRRGQPLDVIERNFRVICPGVADGYRTGNSGAGHQQAIYSDSKLPVWLREVLLNMMRTYVTAGHWDCGEAPSRSQRALLESPGRTGTPRRRVCERSLCRE